MTNLSTLQAKDFWIPALIFLPSVTTAYTSDQCALAQTCIIETFSESLYLHLKENLLCAPICKLLTFWTCRIRGQTFQVEMIFHSYCQIEDKELFSFAYFESLASGVGDWWISSLPGWSERGLKYQTHTTVLDMSHSVLCPGAITWRAALQSKHNVSHGKLCVN